ncbi:hypothetical protein GCM10008090_07770 [Arenicella chitinivorans]|uniref:Uncharacterized protein n=1 Tax=Arenicella chitinivorans TaxID=1329800 RepID=A0A918RJC4_9GAMM|nr:hypothetical protein GCM10008090_07770 [Arenicella chitinivorans]
MVTTNADQTNVVGPALLMNWLTTGKAKRSTRCIDFKTHSTMRTIKTSDGMAGKSRFTSRFKSKEGTG